MGEIIDITFNFQALREAAFKAVENFNNAFDVFCDKKSLWEVAQKHIDLETAPQFFKEFYSQFINDDGEAFRVAKNRAREDIKKQLIESLGELRVQAKRFELTINQVVAMMQARVSYIESTHSQDELYGNYKLREERNGLNKEINQYNKIKDIKLQEAEKFTLESLGLEIEGEPGLN